MLIYDHRPRDRAVEIENIVAQVATQIAAQGRVVIQESSTHILREKHVENLRNGLIDLDKIRVSRQ